jgi:hypothetical protein
MRRTSCLLFASLCAAQAPVPVVPPAPAPLVPPAAMATIAQQELLAHATFLASDELGGRLTGSPGQQQAAKYIADHFAALGLEPLGDEADGKRGFLQHYGIARTHVKAGSLLRVGTLELAHGFAILGARPLEVDFEGGLDFVGLGRTRGSAAEVGGQDDLNGKIAVAVVKPLRGRVDKALSVEEKFGMSMGTFAQLGRTAKNLTQKGARAVLFLQLEDPMGLSDVLNYLALAPGKDTLAARFPGVEPGLGEMSALLGGGSSDALSIVLSLPASQQVLEQLGIEAAAVKAFLGGDGPLPVEKDAVAGRVALSVVHDDAATATNVVAVLRGRDPALAAEAIVYSAHMDHVGMRLDGDVFNGADDNASGSAGLLAIATAYAKAEAKPRRSIVFLSVSGEELGLWGSAYWADHPTWDAQRIVANVNTDMIGRSGPESGALEVTVTPSNDHPKFNTLVQQAARCGQELGLSFTSGDKYYQRSDHYNFAKKGIPVVFFCNGEHEDYHQVSDHADKLDGAKMERIARLAFWTGWLAAEADDAPRALGRRPDWQ